MQKSLTRNASHILKIINKLSKSSTCGPDRIESELIKKLRIPMSTMIGELYRLSLKEVIFPSRLKVAYTSGIYKGI